LYIVKKAFMDTARSNHTYVPDDEYDPSGMTPTRVRWLTLEGYIEEVPEKATDETLIVLEGTISADQIVVASKPVEPKPKKVADATEVDYDSVTKKDIMIKLDAWEVPYDEKMSKRDLYNLMTGNE
jgi:hypothetical protein